MCTAPAEASPSCAANTTAATLAEAARRGRWLTSALAATLCGCPVVAAATTALPTGAATASVSTPWRPAEGQKSGASVGASPPFRPVHAAGWPTDLVLAASFGSKHIQAARKAPTPSLKSSAIGGLTIAYMLGVEPTPYSDKSSTHMCPHTQAKYQTDNWPFKSSTCSRHNPASPPECFNCHT